MGEGDDTLTLGSFKNVASGSKFYGDNTYTDVADKTNKNTMEFGDGFTNVTITDSTVSDGTNTVAYQNFFYFDANGKDNKIDLSGTTMGVEVKAGAGKDTLIAGQGDDVLYGGKDTDADTFVWTKANVTKDNTDYVKDFVSGTDKIDLSAITDMMNYKVTTAGGVTQIEFDRPDGAGTVHQIIIVDATLTDADISVPTGAGNTLSS